MLLKSLIDRRKYIRFYLSKQVHVDVKVSQINQMIFSNDLMMKGIVEDISIGGLKMVVDFSLPAKKGDKLYFSLIFLNDIYPLHGTIAWEGQQGETQHEYGVEFDTEIIKHEKTAELLKRIVDKIHK